MPVVLRCIATWTCRIAFFSLLACSKNNGGECTEDADCSIGEICADGRCRVLCNNSSQCAMNAWCENGFCTPCGAARCEGDPSSPGDDPRGDSAGDPGDSAGDSPGDIGGDAPGDSGPGDSGPGDSRPGDSGPGDSGPGDAAICPGPSAILALGPIRYFRLDDTLGTAVDATGGSTTTYYMGVAGTDYVQGEVNDRACDGNAAVRLQGNQHALKAPDSTGGYIDGGVLPFRTPYHTTVSLWLKPRVATVAQYPTAARVITVGGSNSDFLSFHHDSYQNPPVPDSWAMRDNRGAGDTTAVPYAPLLTVGEWHHIAAVYDGAHLSTYLDGNPHATSVATTTYSPAEFDDPSFVLGASTVNYVEQFANRFDGWIDEVAVFDRVLSPAEILELYQATAGVP